MPNHTTTIYSIDIDAEKGEFTVHYSKDGQHLEFKNGALPYYQGRLRCEFQILINWVSQMIDEGKL